MTTARVPISQLPVVVTTPADTLIPVLENPGTQNKRAVAISLDDLTGAATDAALAAQAAAEAAQGLAEQAQTGAEAAQTAAETAQGLAEAAQTFLGGVYLGAQASDPALDLNGNAVGAGDLYYNTVASELRIYNGATWDAYSAAAGATVFTGLLDVPSDYTGHAGKLVRVNATPDGLEFVDGLTIFQPLDADLTSWAAVARAAGFDTFVATPSIANLMSLLSDDAAGLGTFLVTPSSANLATLITDETGSGALVFANTPTLVTPILGTPQSGTLTNCTGLPLAGLVASTSTAIGVGSVELGHASDCTVARNAAGIIEVEGVPLYSQIPQNSQSTAYTLVLSDAQKHILHPSSDDNARTFTIPANASVAYPIGTCITFVNKINTVTIAITSDTLTWAGSGTTGSRTLAANGMASIIKISTTEWMISGSGLT